MGADDNRGFAAFQARVYLVAGGTLFAARQDIHPDPDLFANSANRLGMLRARISVGAMIADWAPSSATAAIASSATMVLPEPTSPCSSRNSPSSFC